MHFGVILRLTLCFQMSDMQMRNKGMMPGFPTPGFPSNASYPAGSYAANGGTPQAQNGPFPMSKSTPNFCANSFPTTQTSSAMGCSPMPSTSTADASTGASLGPRFPSMELPQFPISTDSTPAIPQQQSQQGQFSTSDSTPYGCGMRPSPSMCPTSPNEVSFGLFCQKFHFFHCFLQSIDFSALN